jgi:hypothetical protein
MLNTYDTVEYSCLIFDILTVVVRSSVVTELRNTELQSDVYLDKFFHQVEHSRLGKVN